MTRAHRHSWSAGEHTRTRIVNLLETEPGLRLGDLARRLNRSSNNVRFHAYRLMREGRVVIERRDGNRTRLRLPHQTIPPERPRPVCVACGARVYGAVRRRLGLCVRCEIERTRTPQERLVALKRELVPLLGGAFCQWDHTDTCEECEFPKRGRDLVHHGGTHEHPEHGHTHCVDCFLVRALDAGVTRSIIEAQDHRIETEHAQPEVPQ